MTAPYTTAASLHLEIHQIRSVNPSNLNRDDAGSPKDATFGGVRRLRLSSQSQKYVYRDDFKTAGLLKPDEIGVRSRIFADRIVEQLVKGGHTAEAATTATTQALVAGGLADLPQVKKAPKAKGKKAAQAEEAPLESEMEELKTGALMFLSQAEISRMVTLIGSNMDALVALADKADPKVVKDMKTLIKATLDNGGDGRRAVDIAMFGRMVAQHPEKGVDGAVQVSSAISTHGLNLREYDYFTAVDDLRRDDQSGSSMIGTNEFSSGTLYQYLTVDVRNLLGTLDGDADLLLRGLEALIRAAILRLPGGRMSSSASYLTPALALLTVRHGTGPRNLSNAFERPVREQNGSGYVEPSIKVLAEELNWQNRVFGAPVASHYFSRGPEDSVFGQNAGTLDALVSGALAEVHSRLQDGPVAAD